jgi:hypothetical protein
VKVVVMKSQPTASPPSLLLTLDVSGKLSDETADDDVSDNEDTALDSAQQKCPVSVGDIVSGIVMARSGQDDTQDAPLKIQLDGVVGLLPIAHLCDHSKYAAAIARSVTAYMSVHRFLKALSYSYALAYTVIQCPSLFRGSDAVLIRYVYLILQLTPLSNSNHFLHIGNAVVTTTGHSQRAPV